MNYKLRPLANTFYSFDDMVNKVDFNEEPAYEGMVVYFINSTEKMKNGLYVLVDPSDPFDINNWNEVVEEIDLSPLNKETLKILLRNTIDAYEDECDMNSPEHFVEKLKEETGITNEEYNELFIGDRQILDDGSVVTYKEEE